VPLIGLWPLTGVRSETLGQTRTKGIALVLGEAATAGQSRRRTSGGIAVATWIDFDQNPFRFIHFCYSPRRSKRFARERAGLALYGADFG
jgi:hypothetical protein